MHARTHRYDSYKGDSAHSTNPVLGQYGTNIGVTDDIGATLSSEQIARFEFGSKCLLAGWNFYVSLIWALKGCMLCFFQRITYGAPGSGIIAHDME